jgi:predicted nucleotidyltransferase
MIPASIIETIKITVHSVLPGARIILFGSMAKGTAVKHSDYDLLVISPANIPKQQKMNWRSIISKKLVYALDAPIDLLLNSEEEVERKKKLLGNAVRWAMNEGVEI